MKTEPDSEPEQPSLPPLGIPLPTRPLIWNFSFFLLQRFYKHKGAACGPVAVISQSEVLSQTNFIFITVNRAGKVLPILWMS